MQPQTLRYTHNSQVSAPRAIRREPQPIRRLAFVISSDSDSPPIPIHGELLQPLLSSSYRVLPQAERQYFVSNGWSPKTRWVPCRSSSMEIFTILLLLAARSQSFEDGDRRESVASPVEPSEGTCDCFRCGAPSRSRAMFEFVELPVASKQRSPRWSSGKTNLATASPTQRPSGTSRLNRQSYSTC
jgi:hypothetical protein